MAGPTGNERSKVGADIAAAARDRGREQIESAKGQLADEADRVASAVDRAADEIEGEGDTTISGFGHSVASLMRQLSGGLRERDVDEFARELASLARRNPGVFLAGSVALGFGVARFFRARSPQSADYGWRGGDDWQSGDDWQGAGWQRRGQGGWSDTGDEPWQSSEEQRWRTAETTDAERESVDAEERLDLSTGPTSATSSSSDTLGLGGDTGTRDDDRNSAKSRQAAKSKAKQQRASSTTAQTGDSGTPSTERSSTDAFGSATGESTSPSGTSDGASRGGK